MRNDRPAWIRAEANTGAHQRVSFNADGDVVIAAAADGDEEPRRPTVIIDPAYAGGAMSVAGFYYPVVVDLAGLRAGAVTILLDHDRTQIVGQGTAEILRSKVKVTAVITGNHDDPMDPAYKIVAHARNGFQWPASVGILSESIEFVKDGEKVKVNGRSFAGPLNVVRRGRLGETSLVGVGADEAAKAKVAANAKEKDMKPKFKKWLKAKGIDPDALADDEIEALQAEYDAEVEAAAAEPESTPEPDGAPEPATEPQVQASAHVDLQAERETRAAEIERLAAIDKVCGAGHEEIKAQAIRDGWTAEKAELAVLKADRPAAPAVHASAPADNGPEVFECALIRAHGHFRGRYEKMFGPKVLEASQKAFGSTGLSLTELLIAHAELQTGKRYRRIGQGNLREILAAGFSTTGLTNILSAVANKYLMDGYQYGDNSDLEVSGVSSTRDFKTVNQYRMTAKNRYELVGPAGSIPHGEMSEDAYTNKADTYAKMFTITRTEIINDDLGVFDQLRREVGAGAAKARRHVFWTEFMDNGSHFSSGNGNKQTGAALTIANLNGAVKLFRAFVDDYDEPIGVNPVMLLVPPALEATAKEYYESTEVRDTTASKKYGTVNIHRGKFRPVVSTYLGNSSYTGYSDTSWYLLADPNEIATIDTVYLNGIQTPTVETADADFDTLGIQMRGYFDFGCNKTDPKGGVKSEA